MTEKRVEWIGESQGIRRLKYGLNVLIAAGAALALVVFLNIIAYRQVHRFDFTSTRRYTLSPQTLTVLREMKDHYKIVTLLSAPPAGGGSQEEALSIANASELTDEYARYGPNISVEHIDPDLEIDHVKRFYASVLERYKDRLQPQKDAIDAGMSALTSVRPPTETIRLAIQKLLLNPVLPDGTPKENLQTLTQWLTRFRQQDDKEIDDKLGKALDSPLPNYSAIISSLKTLLEDRGDKVFGGIVSTLNQALQAPETPAGLKPQLTQLVDAATPLRTQLDNALNQLREIKPVDDYDKLLSQLNQRDIVVVLGSKQESVVPLSDMYRQLSDQQILQIRQSGGTPEPLFQGEERLTGTLISLGLEQHPLVVFVYASGASPLSPRGGYSQVSDRLRKLNFDVMDWSPLPQPNPMGQPMSPGPPPQPQPGQKAVWVILPLASPNPLADPMAGSGNAQIIKVLQDRLNTGDSAMVMLTYTGAIPVGEADPLMDALKPWGISAQTDRLVLRENVVAQRDPQPDPELPVDQWATDLPITKALAGMRGIFLSVSPLLLDIHAAQARKESLWPLVVFQGNDLWAERNVDIQKPGGITKDPATAGGPFVAMAAADNQTSRLIVAGDPDWATDKITTFGMLGEGTAELTGAQFPGNSELFVNSVYWLAGLDRLIAASARSQDIRRVRPMSETMVAYLNRSLLFGMPLAAALGGLAVWMVRRRA